MLNTQALALVAGLWLAAATAPASAHSTGDETVRTAVISAFPPEMAALRAELEGPASRSVNGVEFVTGRLAGRDVVALLAEMTDG